MTIETIRPAILYQRWVVFLPLKECLIKPVFGILFNSHNSLYTFRPPNGTINLGFNNNNMRIDILGINSEQLDNKSIMQGSL